MTKHLLKLFSILVKLSIMIWDQIEIHKSGKVRANQMMSSLIVAVVVVVVVVDGNI
jgi:hypothetical protein